MELVPDPSENQSAASSGNLSTQTKSELVAILKSDAGWSTKRQAARLLDELLQIENDSASHSNLID